jgi:hypothetical protein
VNDVLNRCYNIKKTVEENIRKDSKYFVAKVINCVERICQEEGVTDITTCDRFDQFLYTKLSFDVDFFNIIDDECLESDHNKFQAVIKNTLLIINLI